MSDPQTASAPKLQAAIFPPLEWGEYHPAFIIPSWHGIGYHQVRPSDASRHFLITGETGSGKTKSAVMPLIRAAYEYPTVDAYHAYEESAKKENQNRPYLPDHIDDLRPSMLVIDPKNELLDYLYALQESFTRKGLAPDGQAPDTASAIHYNEANPIQREIIHFGEKQTPRTLWLFEGYALNTSGSSQLSETPLADEICKRIFVHSANLDRQVRATSDPFWGQATKGLVEALVKIDFFIYLQDGISGIRMFWEDVYRAIQGLAKKETNPVFSEQYEILKQLTGQLQRDCTQLAYLAHGEIAEFEEIKAAIYGLITTSNERDRGSYFDAIVKYGRDAREKLETRVGETDDIRAQALVFFTNLDQFEMTGRILMDIPSTITKPWAETLNIPELAYTRSNYLLPHYVLINLWSKFQNNDETNPVVEAFLHVCRSTSVPPGLLSPFQTYGDAARGTISSIVLVANTVLGELASEELASLVSLNPYEPPEPEYYLSISDVIESGDCVIYTPQDASDVHTLIGKMLKAKFFEFTFKRHNRIRPFFYICDEFQRFITSDEQSGEQSFLDRCRAYRAVCILATQSISSLEYTIKRSDSDSDVAHAALAVMLNNTGNKLYFRNSDLATQEMLSKIIAAPFLSDRPSLTTVRPVSTLLPGECYYLTSDGQQGRGQIDLQKDDFSLLYKQYKDGRISAAFTEFEKFKHSVEKYLGGKKKFDLDFRMERNYQQIRAKGWPASIATLDIHYELTLSFQDFVYPTGVIRLALHAEGPRNREFAECLLDQVPDCPLTLLARPKRILAIVDMLLPFDGTSLGVGSEFFKTFKSISDQYTPAVNRALRELETRQS